jgi:hypothetical protein
VTLYRDTLAGRAAGDDYLTNDKLGLADAELRRRYPHAVEYTALDGRPCWALADLTEEGGAE